MSSNELKSAIQSKSEDADSLRDPHASKVTDCKEHGDPPDDWKSRLPFMNTKAVDLVLEAVCAQVVGLEIQQSADDSLSAIHTESSCSSDSSSSKSKMPDQRMHNKLNESPDDISSVLVGDKLPRLAAERDEEPDPTDADEKSASTGTDVHRFAGDGAKDMDERSAAEFIAVNGNTFKEEVLTRPSSPTPPAHTDDDVSINSMNYAASESDNPTDTASFHSARMHSTECITSASLSKGLNVLSPVKEPLNLCHNDTSDAENLTDGEHTVHEAKDYAESKKKRNKHCPRLGSVEFHICDSSSTSPTTSEDDSKHDASRVKASITANNEGGVLSLPSLEQHRSTTSFTKRKVTFEALTTPSKSSEMKNLTATRPEFKNNHTCIDAQSEHECKRSQGQAAADAEPRREDHTDNRERDTVFNRDEADNKLIALGSTTTPANTTTGHSGTCEEEKCESSVTFSSSSSVSLNSCLYDTVFNRDEADNKLIALGSTTTPANTTTGHSGTCEEEKCESSVTFSSSSSVSLSSCLYDKEPPASLDESDAASEPGGSVKKTSIAKTIAKRKKRVARRSSSVKPVAITTLPFKQDQVYEFKTQSCQVAEAVSDGDTTPTKPQFPRTQLRNAASLASLAGAAVLDTVPKPVAKKNEPDRQASEPDQRRALASVMAETSAMNSMEDDSILKKVGEGEAEDDSTQPDQEPDGMKRNAVEQSWSLVQFKPKPATVVVTPSADKQQHSEPDEGARLGASIPAVAYVSPTVFAKADSHDCDSKPCGSNDVDLPSKASAKKNDRILRIIKSSQVGAVDIRKPASVEDNCAIVKAGLSVANNESTQEATQSTDATEPTQAKQPLPLIPIEREEAVVRDIASIEQRRQAGAGASPSGSKLAGTQLPSRDIAKPAAPNAGSLTSASSGADSLPKPIVQGDSSVERASGRGAGDTSNTETIVSDGMEGSVPLTPGKDAAGKDVSLLAFQKHETGSKKNKRAARRESKNKSDWSAPLARKKEATVVNQLTVDNPGSSQNVAAEPVKSIPAATKATNPDSSVALAKLTARNASLQIGDNTDINSPPIKRRAKGRDQAASEPSQITTGGIGSTKKAVPGETEGNAVPRAASVGETSTGPNSGNKITKFSGRCRNCSEKGHKSDVCLKAKNDAGQKTQPKPSLSRSTSNASSNDKRTDANSRWRCNKVGHMRRNCQELLSDEGSGSDAGVVKPLCKENVAGGEQLPQESGNKEIDHPLDKTNDGKCPAFHHEEEAVDAAASHEHVDVERQVHGERADVDQNGRRNTVRGRKAQRDAVLPARGGSLTNGMGRYYLGLITKQEQEAKTESNNSTRAQETLKELFRQSTRAQSMHQGEICDVTEVGAMDDPEAQSFEVGTSASSDKIIDSTDNHRIKQVACPMRYTVTGATVEPSENWSSAVFDRRLRKNIVVHLSCAEPDELQSLFAPLIRRGNDVRCSVEVMPLPETFLPPVADQLLLGMEQWPVDTDDGEKVTPHALVLCMRPNRCKEIHRVAKALFNDTKLKARQSHSGNALSVHDKKMYRGCHLLSCNISRFMALVDIGVMSLKNLRFLVLDEVHLMGRDEDFFTAYLMGLLESQELPPVNERLTLFIAQPNAGELVEQAACMALKRNHAAIHDQ